MAASVLGNIDLLTEILLRLSVKSLMRFKCVSKQWFALISNPSFCHTHTLCRYHTTPRPFPSSLLLAPECSPQFPPFPIIPVRNSDADPSPLMVSDFGYLNVPLMYLSICQSCNGFLLVEEIQDFYSEDQSSYFVCNPITKQFVALSFQSLTPGTKVHSLFLAFDPLRSSHFKVVSIRSRVSITSSVNTEFEIYMYSSETGCWSDLGVRFTASRSLHLYTASGIYCNGAIHWYNDSSENSLYFDVENHCLKEFPMPSNIKNHEVVYFGESGGHLHMILVNERKDLVFDILELKEDYSEWLVRFHVDLNPMIIAFPHWNLDLEDMAKSFFVLCIVRQQKEENSMLVFLMDDKIMSYNLVNYTFRELISFQPFLKSDELSDIEVFQYIENLSWVQASTDY